jgi:hypothetical protein
MSVQTNQYLMWGVLLPYQWSKDWEKAHDNKSFYDEHEEFIADSAFSREITHEDGIFCLFDGMNGEYLVIGRVLAKSSDGELLGYKLPTPVIPLTALEEELILGSIKRNFGIVGGNLGFWFVTHYR